MSGSTPPRALAGRRSFQIALICDNPSSWYVFKMQSGIRDRCEADGVRMIAQPYDRGSDRLADDLAALLAEWRVVAWELVERASTGPARGSGG